MSLFLSDSTFENIFENFSKVIQNLNNFVLENLAIDDKNTFLKNQFQEVCDNNVDYKRIFKTFRNKKSRKIKIFLLIKCELVNNQIYYRDKKRRLILKNDSLRLRFIRLFYDIFFAKYFEIYRYYDIFQRNYF